MNQYMNSDERPIKRAEWKAWAYRCYFLIPTKNGWKATCTMPALAPDLPWKFRWGSVDKNGVREYIDALLMGYRTKSADFESKGFVSETEMFQLERPNDPVIRVNINTFLDFILARGYVDLPLWARVSFVTHKYNKFVPREFIAAFAQIAPEYSEFLNPNEEWETVSGEKMEKHGVDPGTLTSAMNAATFQDMDQRIAERPTSSKTPKASRSPVATTPTAHTHTIRSSYTTPPREVRVSLDVKEGYFDFVTQVIPDDGEPYYTRRIAANDSRLLWCGTSFQLSGPWTVWHRNAAELMALGLDL